MSIPKGTRQKFRKKFRKDSERITARKPERNFGINSKRPTGRGEPSAEIPGLIYGGDLLNRH